MKGKHAGFGAALKMYLVREKTKLNASVFKMTFDAPEIAAKALTGQFVIIRSDSEGERIPLTVADYNRTSGTVTVIFQAVGEGTTLLSRKNPGEAIPDIAGPLGKPFRADNIGSAVVVGGGAGCAITYPVARHLREKGVAVDSIIGFRTAELVILEAEFRAVSREIRLMTDDGSRGEKGFVTAALGEWLDSRVFDEAVVIGPVPMMKAVSELTRNYKLKTTVSLNPIMIDGTGMCGCCRVTVAGETRFACVDGPDFDGHAVDFDRLMQRNNMYREHEEVHRCRLLSMEEV